ncbi:MAG: hypothetical protein F6J90_42470 [Moorea sp. SIOASIH]|nr:hypothetical protein [Moorena sp. SIOASIH]
MRNLNYLLAVSLISVLSIGVQAQGCSDAGFCTMGAMKPDQGFSLGVPVKLRSMEIGWYKGETLLTPTVYAFTADFNFLIGKDLTFQAKVPYQYVRCLRNDGIGTFEINCVDK